MTRALLLLHELSISGAPISVLNCFEAGFGECELWAFAPHDGPLAERVRRLCPLTIVDGIYAAASPLGRLKRKLRVNRLKTAIESWRPQLVYVNSVAALKLLVSLPIPTGVPVLLHVHELAAVAGYVLGADGAKLMQSADRYIAVSMVVARMLTECYGVDPHRIALIPEAIADAGIVRPLPNPVRKGHWIIGGSGAPDVRKGVLLWLQMAVELTRILDNVRFQWVGVTDTFEAQFYRTIAVKLGLGELVEFIPVTNNPHSYFAGFSVFAMTSFEDPCPLVSLEAMALGVPVACFRDGGGTAEQVADAGVVIDGFCPAEMAREISGLLQDAGRMQAAKAEAAKRFDERFAAKVVAPRILEEMTRTARPA